MKQVIQSVLLSFDLEFSPGKVMLGYTSYAVNFCAEYTAVFYVSRLCMGMPQQCVGGRFQDVGRCDHVEKFDYMNGELTLASCLASSQRTFGLNVFP